MESGGLGNRSQASCLRSSHTIYLKFGTGWSGVGILTDGLAKSCYLCRRRVNAGNKKHTQHAPSTKTECDYLNGWIKKRSHTQKSPPKWRTPEIYSYSWRPASISRPPLCNLLSRCVYVRLLIPAAYSYRYRYRYRAGERRRKRRRRTQTGTEVADQSCCPTLSQYCNT